MSRKLLMPSLTLALGAALLGGCLLGGCVSGYQYRSGVGDYYYGQPGVEYRDYGYGGYGGGYGGYGPYGYDGGWGGWGGSMGYGYGYGSPYGYGGYYGSPYGYGGYGYPYYPGRVIRGDGDNDADDQVGPTGGVYHRPVVRGNPGGVTPSGPSVYLPPHLHLLPAPGRSQLPQIGPSRIRPPQIIAPMRRGGSEHDTGRILTP